jgi:class 3 adenylate cyclase
VSAADGEILISDALREALPGKDLGLCDRGLHELKGVPGVWQLFAVEAAGGAACVDERQATGDGTERRP